MHTVLPVEAYGRGNTNRGTVQKPTWGYTSWEEPCFGQLVVAAIKYEFVATDLTALPNSIRFTLKIA